jgi:U3 small nucleolar RNA-associated protein 22
VGKVQWRYFNGNKYTPSLILTPPVTRVSTKERNSKKDPPSKFTVQILMAMESLDWIPPARMFPNRSNIKGHLPSPYYNYMLARDAFSILLPQMILHDMTEFPHFKDTFILSKIWCLQHGFLRGHDTFDETQIAVILSYLFRTKRIASRMAPLQAFTVYVRFLAEEWISKEFVLPENEKNEAQTISACQNNKAYAAQVNQSPLNPQCDPATLLQCHRTFSSSPAIVLNSSMSGNLLGGLSPSFCSSVTYQAKHTLESLTSSCSFSTIFMNTFRFWTCLDSYFHISIDHICWKRAKLWGSSVHDLGEVECITRGLYWTLKKALGDRIVDIRFLTTGNHHNVHDGNSDQIPTYDMSYCAITPQSNLCPLGTNKIVVGLKINPDTCHRAVDRGPPADNSDGVKSFLELWGEAAEIRRFKDGEIVHAVVWNPPKPCLNNKFIIFDGDERTQGGIVERIIQHILTFHFLKETELPDEFMLRDMMSMVEGVRLSTLDPLQKLIASSNAAHRSIMDAFDSLAEFLRANSEIINSNEKGSALGLPLQIDAVEPLSPALRYSCTFPPIPHPSLGADVIRKGISSGVIPYDPITIQIRFGRSSKWPTDVKAIGAAKTAMLFQLIEGIEAMKRKKSIDGFEGPCVVTPFGLLIGYRGYSWRIIVRADPELYLLGNLVSPSEQAKSILKSLTRQHIRAASHHSIVHAIHTSHPSSGHVVRLFNIWMAGHMLSGLIPFEAVELMVAKVYSDKASTLAPPGTVVSGFLRLLRLLSVHDWVR